VKAPELAFRSAREGPGPVQVGRRRRTRREHERAQRLDGVGVPIDIRFEPANVACFDSARRRSLTRRRSKLALREEEFVLEASEERSDFGQGVRKRAFHYAEARGELVEAAVGLDPEGVLRYACPADESGLAAIPGASVEPRIARASGRQGSSSSGELSPWTGQYEIRRTSLCLAS